MSKRAAKARDDRRPRREAGTGRGSRVAVGRARAGSARTPATTPETASLGRFGPDHIGIVCYAVGSQVAPFIGALVGRKRPRNWSLTLVPHGHARAVISDWMGPQHQPRTLLARPPRGAIRVLIVDDDTLTITGFSPQGVLPEIDLDEDRRTLPRHKRIGPAVDGPIEARRPASGRATYGVPRFFAIAVADAANTDEGFENAGRELGAHLADLLDEDLFDELEHFVDEDDVELWMWLEAALPTCAAVIPAAHRDTFLDGFRQAVDEGGGNDG